MSDLPRPLLIGVAAVASAIAIWLVVAETIRRSTTLEPKEIESLLVILVTGCLLDAVVLYRALKRRIGLPTYAWLAIRIALSIAGLLWVTLPSYVIAFIAFMAFSRSRPLAPGTTAPVEPTDASMSVTPSPDEPA